jgi:hypothetical protein
MKYCLVWLLVVSLGCQKFEDFREKDPVYQEEAYFIKSFVNQVDLYQIRLASSRKIENVGRLFSDERFLYISDHLKGIQVYKNPDAAQPTPFLFIEVPGIRNFIVKNKHIISDNGNDLIAINISGFEGAIDQPQPIAVLLADPLKFGVVARTKDLFVYPNFPDARNVYFQCPDSVGLVTEWEKRPVTQKLNCYR